MGDGFIFAEDIMDANIIYMTFINDADFVAIAFTSVNFQFLVDGKTTFNIKTVIANILT